LKNVFIKNAILLTASKDKQPTGISTGKIPNRFMRLRGSAVKPEIIIMEKQTDDLIRKAYAAFNARDIDTALSTMHPDVEWPKAFEGGYVSGHAEIRNYWTRQWTEINPRVEPVEFTERQDGTVEIRVHQIVKGLEGSLIFDGTVKHIYTLQDGLLRRMNIELV
jgi:hypothetical protein